MRNGVARGERYCEWGEKMDILKEMVIKGLKTELV